MAATAANLFTPEDFSSFKESLRGVKDLVDSGIRELPRFYIRSDSRMRVQSSVLPPGGEVPIVDLRELDGSDRGRIVEAVARASEEWGFFQVINHGVEAATIHEMVEVAKEFFAMPVEDRMEIFSADLFKRTRFGTSHNPSQETSLEWKDYLRHPCLPLEESMQSWPTKPASYRRVASDYCRGVKGLADKLLEVLSESLGLERRYLGSVFGSERLQEMFCNYYPPCPNPELTIGIGEHSDVGGITVLLQNEVEGLEVRKDGHWYSIKPVKDAFVVNLGDQLQILSNGRFKSVEHRAKVSSDKLRISIPTFYQPSRGARIRPIPELLDEEHPPAYKEVTFQDYLADFFKHKLQGKRCLDSYKIL
ncbi:protein DMR6-LIKE OXYGENASE 2 [Selaginella moellendorffii]|uniref:protein DMR6-LIKE OXYGENASE 2 n=1 Tax=Selaginella moellendorffii TaxID=88036 RepID=UPI000D1C6608|nr:protein DMR6-LIKE OXYGENASE 2 [Selaginella moellendorffii]|eukprot:XP_024534841.1 protein DMR6-LIKE OXYGENASE 2 [Selaginella moellendorffii]